MLWIWLDKVFCKIAPSSHLVAYTPCGWCHLLSCGHLSSQPSSPIAYWPRFRNHIELKEIFVDILSWLTHSSVTSCVALFWIYIGFLLSCQLESPNYKTWRLKHTPCVINLLNKRVSLSDMNDKDTFSQYSIF